jgi:PAS domain S-box-containing protein
MFNVLLCISSGHDWRLVVIAALVCVPANLAAFFLYAKALVPASRRWVWLAMAGVVAGAGAWTTHFVAMLAFKTGLPVGYAPLATIGSLFVGVIGATLGLAVASAAATGPRRALNAIGGGLVIGLSIALMHYVGMVGYRTTGVLQWNAGYVVASVLVGALLAGAALLVARPAVGAKRLAAAGGLLSLAIIGLHFTGMTAVTIIPDSSITVPAALMSDPMIAAVAAAVSALILIMAISGVAFDAAARGNLRRLREALDVMPEGLAFYDVSDRLVTWNARYADLFQADGAALTVGLPFSDLLARNIAQGVYPEAVGREAEWIAGRLAARWGMTPSLTQKTAGERWLRITERRTADGGTISVNVDITDLKGAEAAMAQARDKAEELARQAEVAETVAGLGHWRLDVRTQQVTWSAQMYRIYDFDMNTPLDANAIMAMTHPDDAAMTARIRRQLATDDVSETATTRVVRANGEVRFVSGRVCVERDAGGEIVAVIGTVVDVTDQKAAEAAVVESEARFRRLAVNAPDIIAESGLDGILTYVSPACLAITGFTPEELVGRPFISLMEPEEGQKVLKMCQAVFASKGTLAAWPVEFRAKHKSGAELWLECKPTLVTDPLTGRFTGLADVIRDIAPRKALEAKLRLAQAEAEAAAAVKGEFLANMSHELRTPLTSIIGFTGLAVEQPDLTDLTRHYVGQVADASRALLCTVNDILDFSTLEAGRVNIQPQPISLAKLSRSTLDMFSPQAGAKNLRLVLDADDADNDLVISVDPDRIRQILLNLLGNAVKFTASGSVTLRTRYDRVAQVLGVDVVDTGEGVSRDKQDCLFKRFSQIDGSLTRAQGGTGLGLAICKGLVEAMNGEIGIKSHEGEGSRFWFRIPAPLASLAKADGARLADQRLDLVGVRVLVVDDNPANRELARLFLMAAGVEISEAADGEEAVQRACEQPYDLILMDVRMPRLDGPGAVRRIRSSQGPNVATPILAFTADADQDSIRRLLAMGFQNVVTKPLSPGVLINAVVQATASGQDRPPMPVLAAISESGRGSRPLQ